jgi:CBS domain containing-hemolysin-like protein
VVLTSNEKSQVQGMIEIHDIITFLVNNYKGEISFFKHYFSKFETQSNISHCSKNQNIVRAQHTDNLYEVLQKLRENKISMIIVERLFSSSKSNNIQKSETVGIVFLTDLMFILRQLNFHEILTQPVLKFIMSLNGTDEDRKTFR